MTQTRRERTTRQRRIGRRALTEHPSERRFDITREWPPSVGHPTAARRAAASEESRGGAAHPHGLGNKDPSTTAPEQRTAPSLDPNDSTTHPSEDGGIDEHDPKSLAVDRHGARGNGRRRPSSASRGSRRAPPTAWREARRSPTRRGRPLAADDGRAEVGAIAGQRRSIRQSRSWRMGARSSRACPGRRAPSGGTDLQNPSPTASLRRVRAAAHGGARRGGCSRVPRLGRSIRSDAPPREPQVSRSRGSRRVGHGRLRIDSSALAPPSAPALAIIR